MFHELAVHPDQFHRQGLGQELLRKRDSNEQSDHCGVVVVEEHRNILPLFGLAYVSLAWRLAGKKDRRGQIGQRVHHLLDLHGVLDDVADRLCGRFVHQVFEHQTGKIAVQALKGAEKQDALFTAAGPGDNPWPSVTSSLLMSSLEKVRPGIRPLFFSQKMEAKDPEKKMPSTAAKATTRSPGRRSRKKSTQRPPRQHIGESRRRGTSP